MNRESLALGLALPTHEARLQAKGVDLLLKIYPVLNSWSLSESKRQVAVSVSIKHLFASLVRNVWRAIVVGETLKDHPKARDRHQFNWSRSGYALIDSVLDGYIPLSDQPKAHALPPRRNAVQRALSRAEQLKYIALGAREFDNPIPYLKSELSFLKNKLRQRDRVNGAQVQLFVHSPTTDIKRILAEGVSRHGWNPISVKLESDIPDLVTEFLADQAELLAVERTLAAFPGSELTRAMLVDSFRAFLRSVPRFWALSRKAEEFFVTNRAGDLPSALIGHPVLTLESLGCFEACHRLAIPVIEIQHGCQHIRYSHDIHLLWRSLPDLYLSFGEFTQYEQRGLTNRGRIVTMLAETHQTVAGAYVRSGLFKRKTKSRTPVRKVLFGSYFLGDGDVCDSAIPGTALLAQEQALIGELARDPNLEVSLKIRGGCRTNLSEHLPKTVLDRITLIGPELKAGHRLCREFDLLAVCVYSTMMLEAASIGIPVLFCPTSEEVAMLPAHFVEALALSPNEIRRIESSAEAPYAVASFSDTEPKVQAFSINYARYADPLVLKKSIEELNRLILDFRAHVAATRPREFPDNHILANFPPLM